jgi:hypothetical protein
LLRTGFGFWIGGKQMDQEFQSEIWQPAFDQMETIAGR